MLPDPLALALAAILLVVILLCVLSIMCEAWMAVARWRRRAY